MALCIKDVVYSLRGNDLNNKGVGQFDETGFRGNGSREVTAPFLCVSLTFAEMKHHRKKKKKNKQK